MQWHWLDHMQTICTLLQTDNHANTSSLNIYRLHALPDAQPTVSKHWWQLVKNINKYGVVSSVLNMMNSVNCRELYPDLQSNLAEFRQHLIDSTADMAPLRVWQLQGTHMWHSPVISAASVYHWWKRSNATSLKNQLVDDEIWRCLGWNQEKYLPARICCGIWLRGIDLENGNKCTVCVVGK